jgi:nucleoid-associated protein YgaU
MMHSRSNVKPITSIPEQPGVLVFFDGHVGVYIGNGQVIEARGSDHGVVQTALRARPWMTWGRCPWIDYCAVPVTQSSQSGEITHVVKQGDTLWALAVRYLGSGHKWREIQALNGGINERKLQIGSELRIPMEGRS